MNWYLAKFHTVSGKPEEYVYGKSKKVIKEFLYNYYSESSSYVILKEDINNTELISIKNKSRTDIKNMIGHGLNPYRAVDIHNGIVWESCADGEIKKEMIYLKN